MKTPLLLTSILLATFACNQKTEQSTHLAEAEQASTSSAAPSSSAAFEAPKAAPARQANATAYQPPSVNGKVLFIEPQANGVVSGPSKDGKVDVTVKMDVRGLTIASAGPPKLNVGHHHLIIDGRISMKRKWFPVTRHTSITAKVKPKPNWRSPRASTPSHSKLQTECIAHSARRGPPRSKSRLLPTRPKVPPKTETAFARNPTAVLGKSVEPSCRTNGDSHAHSPLPQTTLMILPRIVCSKFTDASRPFDTSRHSQRGFTE